MREDRIANAAGEDPAIEPGIRAARSPRDIELARALFMEYAQGLGVDLCFQEFDDELASLPGAYAPPRGRLLLAGAPGIAFGCIALRPLDDLAGEVKRMYVQPAHRGEGWGRRLALEIIAQARVAGYRELKLDTLAQLRAARELYADLGFRECAPYYANPLPDVVYMTKRLVT